MTVDDRRTTDNIVRKDKEQNTNHYNVAPIQAHVGYSSTDVAAIALSNVS